MESPGGAFTSVRPQLFAIAYRMLGSVGEAEDLIQEAYLRWQEAPDAEVRSPRAYLTTIVTRLAINQLRSARAQLGRLTRIIQTIGEEQEHMRRYEQELHAGHYLRGDLGVRRRGGAAAGGGDSAPARGCPERCYASQSAAERIRRGSRSSSCARPIQSHRLSTSCSSRSIIPKPRSTAA
jgi:RNA polymerase sigma factor (sigma-70 family)